MRKWILVFTMLVIPVFAQRPRVDNMKSFRQDLAAAVGNGNLTAEEKQKYEAALKSLDGQRAARKSGTGTVDRNATRQAMQDLGTIARSGNLKQEDRDKLAKHMQRARHGKGKKKAPQA